MLTLVAPLFAESAALISKLAAEICPNRILLFHTWSMEDSAHQNANTLRFYLQSKLMLEGRVEVKPLNCSEHPFSLGDAFSSMLKEDNSNLEEEERGGYHVLITQDSPLGYFFGLTILSGSSVQVSCHLGHTSLNISRTHPNDFTPQFDDGQSIQRLPLFEQIKEATQRLTKRRGSKQIFHLVLGWYEQDRKRFQEKASFRTITLVEYAKKVEGKDFLQPRISNHIRNMIDCRDEIRLIERAEGSKQEYRITSIGRTVGWIMQLDE